MANISESERVSQVSQQKQSHIVFNCIRKTRDSHTTLAVELAVKVMDFGKQTNLGSNPKPPVSSSVKWGHKSPLPDRVVVRIKWGWGGQGEA